MLSYERYIAAQEERVECVVVSYFGRNSQTPQMLFPPALRRCALALTQYEAD